MSRTGGKDEWAVRTKPIRAEKWDSGFICCAKHPQKRCLRSRYISQDSRRCSACHRASQIVGRCNKWDAGFIPCINHPDRRCNRSFYVHTGKKKCGTCRHILANGSVMAARKRGYISEQRRWRERSMRTRERIDGAKF